MGDAQQDLVAEEGVEQGSSDEERGAGAGGGVLGSPPGRPSPELGAPVPVRVEGAPVGPGQELAEGEG